MGNATRSPVARSALALLLAVSHANAASPTGVVRLHLEFVQSTPVTTLSIGGHPIRAIVDTSAGDADGALTLTPDAIARGHGAPLGMARMEDAQGRRFDRPRFELPVVIVDGREYHDVRVVEALPSGKAGFPVVNVIGKHFLSRHFVVIDFAAATINLWPRDIRDPESLGCGRVRIPMAHTKEARLAVSAFELPTGRVRLAWATNAPHSMLAESTRRKLNLATFTRGPGSPPFFEAPDIAASGQRLGALEFVILPLRLPADFDGVIGGDFFASHVVCLDYVRREVRIR